MPDEDTLEQLARTLQEIHDTTMRELAQLERLREALLRELSGDPKQPS